MPLWAAVLTALTVWFLAGARHRSHLDNIAECMDDWAYELEAIPPSELMDMCRDALTDRPDEDMELW